jgi:hypothetical protein
VPAGRRSCSWRRGQHQSFRRAVRERWQAVGAKLDERGRRLFAAGEIRAAGRGGKVAVAHIAGLAFSTIGHGLRDLDVPLPRWRVPAKGGGRQRLSIKAPTLVADLERVVAPAKLGCPMRPLLRVS